MASCLPVCTTGFVCFFLSLIWIEKSSFVLPVHILLKSTLPFTRASLLVKKVSEDQSAFHLLLLSPSVFTVLGSIEQQQKTKTIQRFALKNSDTLQSL